MVKIIFHISFRILQRDKFINLETVQISCVVMMHSISGSSVFRMLASLGIRSRVVSLESKCLLRFLKLSAGPNRLSNYLYGETVAVFNPPSLQFSTSLYISIQNSLPNASFPREARRFFHATGRVCA